MKVKTRKITAKDKLLEMLDRAEQKDLVERIKSECTNFKCQIVLMLLHKQDILLSFICGFIANLPISVLFNILTIDIAQFNSQWSMIVYFVLYGLCLISTAALTVVSFQFTIKYAKVSRPDTLSGMIFPCLNSEEDGKNTTPLSYLATKFILFVVFAICSALLVVALFVVNFCVV